MAKEKDKIKLTPKQKIFCHEYIIDWNATRAAKVAKYSEKTARQTGYEILTKPYIQDYIKLITSDLEKEAGVSKLKMLTRLSKVMDNEETANTPYVLKSIEILAKMLGYYESEKIDHKVELAQITGIQIKK